MWSSRRGGRRAAYSLVLHTNRVRLRAEGNNRQAEEQNTLQVAAAVCGTGSMASFSLLGDLVPCYPTNRLRPACANYAPPSGEDARDNAERAKQARHPPTPHDSFREHEKQEA